MVKYMRDEYQNEFDKTMNTIMDTYYDKYQDDDTIFHDLLKNWLNANGYDLIDI